MLDDCARLGAANTTLAGSNDTPALAHITGLEIAIHVMQDTAIVLHSQQSAYDSAYQ